MDPLGRISLKDTKKDIIMALLYNDLWGVITNNYQKRSFSVGTAKGLYEMIYM